MRSKYNFIKHQTMKTRKWISTLINKQFHFDKYEAKEDSEKLAVTGNQTRDN